MFRLICVGHGQMFFNRIKCNGYILGSGKIPFKVYIIENQTLTKTKQVNEHTLFNVRYNVHFPNWCKCSSFCTSNIFRIKKFYTAISCSIYVRFLSLFSKNCHLSKLLVLFLATFSFRL